MIIRERVWSRQGNGDGRRREIRMVRIYVADPGREKRGGKRLSSDKKRRWISRVLTFFFDGRKFRWCLRSVYTGECLQYQYTVVVVSAF